jgi:hypothetical protein
MKNFNRIADFILEKMSAYHGNCKPQTAAHFTRGELQAIYNGNHYSRDTYGAWRITPAPEPLPAQVAMEKADAYLTELLQWYTKQAQRNGAAHGQAAPETEKQASMKQCTPTKNKRAVLDALERTERETA